MIRSTPISTQVFDQLFPHPQKGLDPSSWHEHVKKNLVPEIRLEVHQFYGTESRTDEGKYPGMDYNSAYHRMRLRRYPFHRRLFRALDALGLTDWEIYMLCDWEGTLLVKGRYEQQQGIVLRDTTGDEIASSSSPDSDDFLADIEDAATAAEAEEEEDHLKDDELDDEDEDEIAFRNELEAGGHEGSEGGTTRPDGQVVSVQLPRAVGNITISRVHDARLRMLTASRGSTPARAAA